MKKIILSLAVVLLFSASSAFAACSAEEMQSKAMTVSTQLQALAQKDAARFQKVMEEFQQKTAQLQQKNDMDALCAYYDELIEATK
ncbi:BTB/POZ domain-containing protein KCTD2 [Desulfovibrio sp. OttesenSCG-928-I05]|nr:BTB/POZ domain-containing protein KCTD2 [Desulfovibrio sp. OttesenSCG-928-I05]